MQGGGYDQGFHEIHQISPWEMVDFTQISLVKSTQNYKSKCFSKNSSVWWMQGGGYDQGFHPWNLVDFTQISPVKSTQIIKASVSAKNSSVWWMQGGGYDQGFHEIHQISPWNLADLTSEIQWISPRYHLWNPPKIIKTSVSAKTSVWWMQGGGFHPWNPVDFTLKSGGFYLWNLVDFTQISPVKSTQDYKSKCFSKNSSVWWMQGGGYDQGFHEIHQISPWNLADLTSEIQWISPRYHLWNPPKIIKTSVSAKTSVWWMQGGGFHPWNPVDFTLKSGGFYLWNLVDFTQISPVKSTQDYKSKCFSKNSSVWWMQGGGYDQGFHEIHQISSWEMVDFNHEIWQISPIFHLWNPPKIIKASVSAQTLQFDECRVGAMTKDFTHEIWWISSMKSGRFHPDLTCEIRPKL